MSEEVGSIQSYCHPLCMIFLVLEEHVEHGSKL